MRCGAGAVRCSARAVRCGAVRCRCGAGAVRCRCGSVPLRCGAGAVRCGAVWCGARAVWCRCGAGVVARAVPVWCGAVPVRCPCLCLCLYLYPYHHGPCGRGPAKVWVCVLLSCLSPSAPWVLPISPAGALSRPRSTTIASKIRANARPAPVTTPASLWVTPAPIVSSVPMSTRTWPSSRSAAPRRKSVDGPRIRPAPASSRSAKAVSTRTSRVATRAGNPAFEAVNPCAFGPCSFAPRAQSCRR